ncbi:unnamed protein product [Linum trigynum]|uniref:Uncharacterized protein n=1 Tax=Linum trigynum TaxID=586398 RepID=A0AAV2ECN6_9ROSI
MAHAVAEVPLDYSHLFFGVVLPFIDHNHPAPLPFGTLISQLLLALPINLNPYRFESPTVWLTVDMILDDLDIAIEGEVNLIWISDSDYDSDDSDTGNADGGTGNDGDGAPAPAPLEPFAAAILELYGSYFDASQASLSHLSDSVNVVDLKDILFGEEMDD